jgi:hypothetical protein
VGRPAGPHRGFTARKEPEALQLDRKGTIRGWILLWGEHMSRPGTIRRLLLLAAVAAVAFSMSIARARAASYPLYTYSVYIQTMDGTAAYNAGCSVGSKVGAGTRPAHSLVILDFGYPYYQNGTWGALLLDYPNPFESLSAIAAVTEAYGHGWYECSPSGSQYQLRVAIGENSANTSAGNYFTNADGAAWAGMVVSVNSWFATNGYSSQVSAAGAADIENATYWATATSARAWVDGFSSHTSYAMYDFGAASGCSYANTYANNPCNAGWMTADEWYVSWHGVAYPAPEDYNTTRYCAYKGCSYGNVDPNSRQWEAISRYGYHYQGGAIRVEVVVTQYEACVQRGGCSGINNTPAQGDADMYDALNYDYAPSETSQSLDWTTDMEWGYTLS